MLDGLGKMLMWIGGGLLALGLLLVLLGKSGHGPAAW